MIYLLLPLYSCRWFAGDIVDDAVDMVYFVDDTNRYFLQNIPRNLGKVSCHAINRSDSANRNCVVVSSAVSHDPNRSDASINSKVLPDVAVKPSFGDFVA